MTDSLISRVEQHDYAKLFIQDLNWNRPDHAPITYTHDGSTLTATNVSSYKGLRVWVCNQNPGAKLEAALDHLIAKTTTDRLVIFHDDTEQVWRWPVRSRNHTITIRPARHRHRTGTPDPKFANRLEAIRLPVDVALDTNTVLGKVRSAFDVEAQNETKHASKLMARMYAAMEKAYPAGFDAKTRDHQISVTLARILFLMFGDDTDMWQTDLFRDYIHRNTNPNGSDLAQQLTRLFQHLDTPPEQRSQASGELEGFRYVNGGIFSEHLQMPPVGADFRAVILEACDRDWSAISPAIFGSMFQSVRDAKTRRELGEHYTSEENILKTLNPLFLDELRDELASALNRDTRQKQVNALRALWDKIGDIRYMDPACGCGNFIIVAYRELRGIELQIMEALTDRQEAEGQTTLGGELARVIKVTLDHFYGIEIDEWPAKIAQTAMFMIDRQCDLKLRERFGEAPERLPIRREARIEVGNALRTDWAKLLPPDPGVIIAGNPPFLGISLRSAQQTSELERVWGTGYHGTLDYVTGWHAKALEYFHSCNGRWAFVTTNSITQGEAVAPLFQPILDEGWKIRFAHRTFPWASEAAGQAAVHCVIIGFSRDLAKSRLFDYPAQAAGPVERSVANITPYLTDGPTVIVRPSTRPLNPQLGEVVYGNKPTDGGFLIIEPEDYDKAMADPVAAKYVRRYVGARELLHGEDRYCLWLTSLTNEDRASSKLLDERIRGVEEFRADSKAESTRGAVATAHLFRQIAQPDTSYLCIPAHVSESRPYFLTARFGSDTVASNANFITADPDGFMFAIISSTMFITWQRTVGGRIKSDLRFNKLLTWNTFPLPPTDPDTRGRIIAAGQNVLRARDLRPDASLAELYNPKTISPELASAHHSLDIEVDRLFGLPSRDSTELQRQDVLFARYQEFVAPLLAEASIRPRRSIRAK